MVHPSVVGSALFEAVLSMVERSSPAQFAAQINALLNRPDAAPVLPMVTCSTLILTGREDLCTRPTRSHRPRHPRRGAAHRGTVRTHEHHGAARGSERGVCRLAQKLICYKKRSCWRNRHEG
jgi:hypothetical protein